MITLTLYRVSRLLLSTNIFNFESISLATFHINNRDSQVKIKKKSLQVFILFYNLFFTNDYILYSINIWKKKRLDQYIDSNNILPISIFALLLRDARERIQGDSVYTRINSSSRLGLNFEDIPGSRQTYFDITESITNG